MPYYNREQLEQTNLHFIIGSNRSGTTLLTTILNAHPQVFATPEMRFVMALYNPYFYKNKLSPRIATDIRQYVTLLFNSENTNEQINAWRKLISFDEQVLLNFDLASLDDFDYASISKLFLLNLKITNKDTSHVKTIVDKNPNYIFYVKQLIELYPAAKFIVAMRDYRAVLLSTKQSGHKKGELLKNMFRWKWENQEIWKLHQQFPNKLLLIPYEQLSTSPKVVINNVCNFIGIEFDENMLQHNKKIQDTAEVKTNNERTKKIVSELAKPINASRVDAWKTQLSEQEIAITDLICGNIGSKFGYAPISKKNFYKKTLFYLQNSFQIIKQQLNFSIFIKYYFLLSFSTRLWLSKFFRIK